MSRNEPYWFTYQFILHQGIFQFISPTIPYIYATHFAAQSMSWGVTRAGWKTCLTPISQLVKLINPVTIRICMFSVGFVDANLEDICRPIHTLNANNSSARRFQYCHWTASIPRKYLWIVSHECWYNTARPIHYLTLLLSLYSIRKSDKDAEVVCTKKIIS